MTRAQEVLRELLGYEFRTLTVTGQMVCLFCGRSECRQNCLRHDLPQLQNEFAASQARIERLTAALESVREYVSIHPTADFVIRDPFRPSDGIIKFQALASTVIRAALDGAPPVEASGE